MTTPAKQLGYSEGQAFRMLETEAHAWSAGDIITLQTDDGTMSPLFCHATTAETRYVQLRNIEPAPAGAIEEIANIVQSQAITTFNTMLARALEYRSGAILSDTLFYRGYGICDNIERCTPNSASSSVMALIKDNVIRRLPSYSGNYHYPVSCPANPGDAVEAGTAWGTHADKWDGEYGQNRVVQLTELIAFIENQWDPALTKPMTPCVRVGIIPKVTLCQFSDGTFWNLDQDDGSTDPYFRPVGGGERKTQDLRYVKIVPNVVDGKKRSVAAFLKEIAKEQANLAKLQAKIADLQKLAAMASSKIGMLDYNLSQTHKVKRLDK